MPTILVVAGLANASDVRDRLEGKQAQTVALVVGVPKDNIVALTQVITYVSAA